MTKEEFHKQVELQNGSTFRFQALGYERTGIVTGFGQMSSILYHLLKSPDCEGCCDGTPSLHWTVSVKLASELVIPVGICYILAARKASWSWVDLLLKGGLLGE